MATVLSVLLIIALIVVVVRIVIFALNRLLSAMHLSALNKAIGTVLGFANGLLVVIILMVMLDFIPGLSTPLQNGENHRVYAGINVLKEELFTKFKLTQRMKFIKMPITKERRDTPPDFKN
jgi:uncharacterized membrane protein required for colicin V production